MAPLETALEALSNIDDVTVTEDSDGFYTVTFLGTLAATNVAALTVNTTNVTTTDRRIRSIYDAKGQLLTRYDLDRTLNHTYDAQGRITEVDNDPTFGFPVVVLAYGYDVKSQRTSLAVTINGTKDFQNNYGRENGTQLISSGGPTD